MTPTLSDKLRALDDLEHVFRVMFEGISNRDEDPERLMRRALAVLHAAIKAEALSKTG